MNVNGDAHPQPQKQSSGIPGAGGSSTTSSYQANGISEHGSLKGGVAAAAAAAASSVAMPPPTSLPTSVKSEKAQGKARQVDDLSSIQWPPTNGTDKSNASHPIMYDDTPPEALLAELLPQTENLVPLAAIVERMSNYGYEALQILSETMSSLPSDQRREKIFTTAVTVQRQIAKLVALVLWSRLSGDLQKARNTVGLLCEQFAQAEDAVRELTSIRTMLPHSRLRNFDLLSAMDVLRSGAYTRLPSTIKTSAMHEKPMDDKAVDELVEELEDAIRLRLSCHDVLPLQMSDYRIADGRAHFDVPNLFEASLTVDGPYPSGRWYLLTIKFHFKVTGTGKDHFPRVPKKHYRDLLLEQVNAELAPPPPLPPEAEPTDTASSGQPPPLVKFFRHLESRALQYQLDILAFQAGELGHGLWKGHLSVQRDSQTQALRLTYWSQLRSKPDALRGGRPPAAQSWRNGGSITISIETEQGNRCTARSIAQVLFGGTEVDDVDSLYRKRLAVDWRVEKSIKDGSPQNFVVNVHALDIRNLLLDVVSAHAHAILDSLRSKILRSSLVLGVADDDCTLGLALMDGEKDSFPSLRIKLCGAMSVCIALQPISGHISIEEDVVRVPDAFLSGETGTKADAAIFAQSTERLNRDPDQIVEVLQALRQYAICKDLEQKACFLGLEAVQRLPFQPTEYGKLGAPPEAVLFLSLPQCPHWYLAAQFSAHPPRLALLSTATYVMHGQIYMVINTLQWINRSKVLTSLSKSESTIDEAHLSLADIDLDEIAHLHWYGVAIVSYFRIEQQLQSRGLLFSHTTSLPPLALDQGVSGKMRADAPVNRVASKIPAICMHSADVLGPSSALVKPNIFVRLSKWWDRGACTAQVIVRLSLRSASRMTKLEPPGGGSTIEYDATSRQLTFSTPDIDNCITWFLVEWDRFARIGMLVKAVERARVWPGGRARGWKVTNFNFFQASFAYSHGRCATVTWSRSPPGHAAPESFLLRVYSDRPKKGADQGQAIQSDEGEDVGVGENPHEYIEAALEQNLNVGSSYSPGFWPSFLCLLHETLPVLEILREACKDELSDANAPALEFRSACWYRLTYGSRYALDVRYLTGSRFIIADAARPLFGASKNESAGSFACLPSFHRTTKEAVTSYYSLASQFAAASAEASDGIQRSPTESQGSSVRASPSSSPAAVDLRRAVLCAADEAVVGPILSAVLASVREQLRVTVASNEAAPAEVGPSAS
ncbi:hypothetical protein CF327_g95 [Tilletia walkeri]|nr:hypothetical protein CF327_g95 [Tilletia walkeri]